MFPGAAVVVDGVIRSAPQTVKPPLQKKSNQPKKPAKTKPTNWGKPTRQTQKYKQNQYYNNMHRVITRNTRSEHTRTQPPSKPHKTNPQTPQPSSQRR
ncbi:hypothetical protein, partial [Stappia sp. 28M-7]|uniref:hypothetical protein n=1 Tax=Stappia sp. 28M-7 TaxID=2762596 RepID=UPI001AD8E126